MYGVAARIILRYLAGYLVARGLVTTDFGATLAGDADLASAAELLIGLGIGAASEGWYILARKFGWAK